MKERFTKLIALTLVAIMMCMVFTACNSDNPNDGSQTGDGDERVLGIGFKQDPGTFDPFAAGSAGRYFILLPLYEKLALMNSDGVLTGVLAKKWDVEGTTYTIELYDYITDSAGNPFTADDAIWCLETLLEKGTNPNVMNIQELERVNDYTFKMVLNSDLVGLFEAICVNTFFCTRKAYESSSDNMATDPVGTGAYKMDKVEMGISYSMVVNEDYWQKEELRVLPEQQTSGCDRVNYYIQTEAAQLIVALETGIVDLIISDADSAARFEKGGASYGQGFSVDYREKAGNKMIWLNMSEGSVFNDNLALRKAILYAIDAQTINLAAAGGHAVVPTSLLAAGKYPDMGPGWVDNDYFTTDIELAKQYLKEAGYKEGELTLNLLGQPSSTNQLQYEAIKGCLAKIGVNVKLNVVESAIYSSSVSYPEEWDLICDAKGATDYAASIIRDKLNNTNTAYGTYSFIQDERLQELVDAAIHIGTHSQDTVDAVLEYVEQQAYGMGFMSETECVIYNSVKIAQYSLNVDDRPAPGAFVFN